jgi:NDP-sugar pyrophosphorylase family protein
MIKAVIMAGGSGTRLQPLTFVRPKPMIPLINKPILQYSLDKLKEDGFKEVIITLGYMWDHVKQHFKRNNPGVELKYTVEKWPLGTAGGVKKAKKYLDDTFVVLSGDVIIEVDLKDVIRYHQEKNALATMVLTNVDDPSHFGIANLDEDGRIVDYLEKPDPGEAFSNLANAGTYIFEPEIFDYMENHRRMIDFSKDIFPQLIKEVQAIYGYPSNGYWNDLGRPETYMKATRDLLGRSKVPGQKIEEEIGRLGDIWLGKNVKIGERVRIEGPVVIGDEVVVGAGTKISSGTVLGENVILGENVNIHGSVIFSNTEVNDNVFLENSIVDRFCFIDKDSVIESGVVIGSAVEIGRNSIIKSSRRITRAVKIFPGSIIDSDYLIAAE